MPSKSAGKLDPEVTRFLAASKHPLAREMELLRRILLAASPAIAEGVKWNTASFRTADYFATLNGPRHTERPMLILHAGAKVKGAVLKGRIPDPAGLLRWLGDDRALIEFRDAAEIREREKPLQSIVRAWVAAL